MEANKGILLESGTNELEIVEFGLGKNKFGINVIKVKEGIHQSCPHHACPSFPSKCGGDHRASRRSPASCECRGCFRISAI